MQCGNTLLDDYYVVNGSYVTVKLNRNADKRARDIALKAKELGIEWVTLLSKGGHIFGVKFRATRDMRTNNLIEYLDRV